jgi:hypothetical protein
MCYVIFAGLFRGFSAPLNSDFFRLARVVICAGRHFAVGMLRASTGFVFLKISNNSSIYQLQINGSKNRIKVEGCGGVCQAMEVQAVRGSSLCVTPWPIGLQPY